MRDAIEIGARVLDREQTGANADFVKAEFERAARELDAAFVERARRVAERLDKRIDDVFGPESGHLTKALARHFGDESSRRGAAPGKALLTRGRRQMREDLRRQFSSDGENNPLASFQRMAHRRDARQRRRQQAQQLRAMDEKLAALREELVELRAEKEKLEEVAAEAERGTAKGRTYEEEVAAAHRRARAAAGRRLRRPSATSRSRRARRATSSSRSAPATARRGPDRLRGQERRLSRPEALRQLDDARRERNADYAVLVVPPRTRSRRGCTRCASTTATS